MKIQFSHDIKIVGLEPKMLKAGILGMIILFLSFSQILSVQAQSKIRDLTDADIYLKGVFGQDCQMDEYGNLQIQAKAFGGTPAVFRLTDVIVRMDEKRNGPQCPPPCKEELIITMECRKSACMSPISADRSMVWPPSVASYKLTFEDIKKGRKVFLTLLELQRFLRQSNMQVPAK